MERMEPGGWPAAGEKRAPARWLMYQNFTKTRQEPRPFRDATAADTPRTQGYTYNYSAITRKPSSHRLGVGWGGAARGATSAKDKQHDKGQGKERMLPKRDEGKAVGIEAGRIITTGTIP